MFCSIMVWCIVLMFHMLITVMLHLKQIQLNNTSMYINSTTMYQCPTDLDKKTNDQLNNILHTKHAYCKSTNFGVLLYLVDLANCVFLLIFVAANIYVDRTLHRRATGRRQI